MDKSFWQYDLRSSIVVFLVALPLCLGIALASGAPLASGLIAGIVGGLVVGGVSSSHVSVSGPAAGLTVIVAQGILQMGSFEIFCVAVVLAGIVQFLFGLLRGGAIGDYFPGSVIRGMLAAIGLILILKQLPTALGMPKGSWDFTQLKSNTLMISAFSLSLMILWDHLASKGNRFFKTVPGPLVAVIGATALNGIFHLVSPSDRVALPSSVFGGFSWPQLSHLNLDLIILAFTLAIVASLETLLCLDAADKLDPYKRRTDKNRELMAQGMGNFVSGLLGGLPLTAVIVRTSANIEAGARSKLSTVFHGGWLLACVLIIPQTLGLIPLASLACVLLLVGYKLVKPAHFVEMKKRGLDQLIFFCLTIGAILATDLLRGIFIGLLIALLFDFKRWSLSCFVVKTESDGLHLRLNRSASFLHKASFSRALAQLTPGQALYIHGLDEHSVHIDVWEYLERFKEENQLKHKVVLVSGANHER